MAGLVTVPSNLPVEAVATQPSDMDALLFDRIGEAVLKVHSDSLLIYEFSNGDQIRFRGEFDYTAPGILSGGSLFQIMQYKNGALQFDINELDVSAVVVLDEIRNGRTAEVFEALLSGANKVAGSHGDDLLRTHGGGQVVVRGTNGGFDAAWIGVG